MIGLSHTTTNGVYCQAVDSGIIFNGINPKLPNRFKLYGTEYKQES